MVQAALVWHQTVRVWPPENSHHDRRPEYLRLWSAGHHSRSRSTVVGSVRLQCSKEPGHLR